MASRKDISFEGSILDAFVSDEMRLTHPIAIEFSGNVFGRLVNGG